jgi:hypothetical protein
VVIESMRDETRQFGAPSTRRDGGWSSDHRVRRVAGLMLARGATRRGTGDPRAIGAAEAAGPAMALTGEPDTGATGAVAGVLLACCTRSLVALVPLSRRPTHPWRSTHGSRFALGDDRHRAPLRTGAGPQTLARTEMISTMLAGGGRSGAPLSKRGQWLIGIEVARSC